MPAIDESWREAMANACEARADAITDALAEVENVGQCLAEHEALTASGRAYAGYLRAARNDLLHEARTLRAGVA